MSERGRLLYELPAHVARLDAVRGTILALDWRALRTSGVYEAYEAALGRYNAVELLSVTSGSWVSVELLQAHYRALDSLELDAARIKRVGHDVGDGVHGAFLSTLIRLAGQLGISPWLALEQSYKLWVRSWRGGAIQVEQMAARTARVTLLETPVCASRFFRVSFAGALCAGIAPFGTEPEANEVVSARTQNSVAYRITWTASAASRGWLGSGA